MESVSVIDARPPRSGAASASVVRLSTITLLLLGGAVLLPQGVGIRSPGGLPNFDLPRLCALGVIGLFLIRSLITGRMPLRGAPRTLGLLVFIALWQVVAALSSASPAASLMWAGGNALTMWLFAIASISLVGGHEYRARVARTITIVALLLSAWSVLELVTQRKLVPVRNLWRADELGQSFSTTLRRLIPGTSIMLPYMSIGPFSQNLTLAGALCGLGGFLVARRGRQRASRSRIALFITAVLATQSRVGTLAMAFMLFMSSSGKRRYRDRWRLMVTAAVVVLLIAFIGGNQIRMAVQEALSDAGSSQSVGSFSMRFRSLQFLLAAAGDWWLVGYGPGSILDADRVVTSVQTLSDPGSYFAFYLESGMPTGLAVTLIMFASIRNGLRSATTESRAAAVSLAGFWVTTLSSITPWSWGMALAIAGFVEGWTRAERRGIAADA